MDSNQPFSITYGEGPIVATAIHQGHLVRENLKEMFGLTQEERLREEDPFTNLWVDIVDTWILGNHSRFEVDLNRPREKAVYLNPEDAWGLNVWKQPLPKALLNESLKVYDRFYEEIKQLFDQKIEKYGCVVVYDLHSYNHRRGGSEAPAANPEENPEINVGTGNMDRKKWDPVVKTFMEQLKSFPFDGRHLDVRENVKFQGGHFLNWIHSQYPGKSCVLAIEVKKFFMDEWTGIPDQRQINLIKEALRSTVGPVKESLNQVYTSRSTYGNL